MKKLLLLGLLCVCAPVCAEIMVGSAPPENLGKDADGNKVAVSDYRGRVLVISFFASWCGPCRKELPMLAEIQKAAGRDKVTVIAVNFKEDRKIYKKLSELFAEHEVTMTHDPNGNIGARYGVNALPRLVIVGKDGLVAAEHVGYGEKTLPKLVKEINAVWRGETQMPRNN